MKIVSISAAMVILVSSVVANDVKVPEKNERQPEQTTIDGYNSTPLQPAPDDKWHIHDPERTQPPVAEPKYDGNVVPAPEGAILVFDGKSLDKVSNKKWPLIDGVMVAGKHGAQKSMQSFGDIHLHLEWFVPVGLKGWGQKQGNSGVFLMGKYEVQVLNCWANRTYPDGMTGALYGQTPPLVNACKKPGEWQSYDIHFTAPVFDKDRKMAKPAVVTVYLNNVLVQEEQAYLGASTWKKAPKYVYHPGKQPFSLQSHGNPVQYRNIWVSEK